MSESILKTLRDEHRRAEGMIIQIENSKDIVQKKELYLQLRDELIPHMEGEERSIYSHLINDIHDEEAEEVAELAKQDHQKMKELLGRLDNILIESDEWDSTFRQLCQKFRKHVKDEESALFAEAKQDFTKDELVELGDEFNEIKQQITPY